MKVDCQMIWAWEMNDWYKVRILGILLGNVMIVAIGYSVGIEVLMKRVNSVGGMKISLVRIKDSAGDDFMEGGRVNSAGDTPLSR